MRSFHTFQFHFCFYISFSKLRGGHAREMWWFLLMGNIVRCGAQWGQAAIDGIYHHGLAAFTCYVGWYHHTSIVDCRTQRKISLLVGRCQVFFAADFMDFCCDLAVLWHFGSFNTSHYAIVERQRNETHLLAAFQEVLTCLVWERFPLFLHSVLKGRLQEMLAFPILKKNFANPGSDSLGWKPDVEMCRLCGWVSQVPLNHNILGCRANSDFETVFPPLSNVPCRL